jgi:L-arabinonolactonase
MTTVQVIDAPVSTLGEGPMWSVRDQALYWIDVVGKRAFRLRPPHNRVEARDLPYAPSGVFPRVAGGLLLVTKKGMALFDFDADKLETIPTPAVDFTAEVFNDGGCDRLGRLWIGTRDLNVREPKGGLYRMETDYSMTRQASGFVVSNGVAWSPNGETFYHVDSKPGRIDVCDFDLAAGLVANRRVFLDYRASGGPHPDGCAVDAEGGLWVAEIDAGRVARYTPDARFDREIGLPVSKPTSVMFGGKDLATMYITSMRFHLTHDALQTQPLAGSLFAVDAGVKGMAEPEFGVPA